MTIAPRGATPASSISSAMAISETGTATIARYARDGAVLDLTPLTFSPTRDAAGQHLGEAARGLAVRPFLPAIPSVAQAFWSARRPLSHTARQFLGEVMRVLDRTVPNLPGQGAAQAGV